MKEAEMQEIASFIDRVLSAPEDANVARDISAEVKELTARFPLYPNAFGAKGAEIGA
jgi:glycine/serine hydroxymethyltransferase